MVRSSIDFRGISDAAIAAIKDFLPQWLPGGKKSAGQWIACNPVRGEANPSFSVSLDTGAWFDHGSGDKGGDLISLYAYLFSTTQAQAAQDLAQRLGIQAGEPIDRPPRQSKEPPKEKVPRESKWTPLPVADTDVPYPRAHPFRGIPQSIWEYRTADGKLVGIVCRFVNSTGGKVVLPCVWAEHTTNKSRSWQWIALGKPRPLYRLQHLRVGVTKLIVEGEKCADAGAAALGDTLDVISWPGGGKAFSFADWTPISGADVLIWPDADAQRDRNGELKPADKQPGIITARGIAEILVALKCNVRIMDVPPPGEKKEGWDIADAIEEGLKGDDLRAFVRANLRRPMLSVIEGGGKKPPPTPTQAPAMGDEESWFASLVRRKGDLVACAANVVEILTHEKRWSDVIGFDEFATRVVKQTPAPFESDSMPTFRDWTDVDDSETAIWVTKAFYFPVSSSTVREAVDVVARRNGFHPVREYLDSLTWDGTYRTGTWLKDYLGVELTEYSTRVARWFLMGMVKRVLEPGVKFDYCLVLEGKQGRQKSSAFRVLAGEYFSDTELDLSNKDSMSNIQGKWLHEFAEMGSLARAESNRQKSFLSRQSDVYRPAYARREVTCPRQVVFGGTTNEWAWNKDPTGGRRFWPVEVLEQIDIDGLQSVRDQLFAEAYDFVRQGERYWPTPEEQETIFDPEQLMREVPNPFVESLEDWFKGSDTFWLNSTSGEFRLSDALHFLKAEPRTWTPSLTTQVGIALSKLGCEKIERRNSAGRFFYKRPTKKVAPVTEPVEDGEDDDLPI